MPVDFGMTLSALVTHYGKLPHARHRTVLADGQSTRTWTELDVASALLARQLDSLTADRGGVIACLVGNRVEFFDLLFGTARAGHVLLPLPTGSTLREIDMLTGETELLAVATDEDHRAISQALADNRQVPLIKLEPHAGTTGTEALGHVPVGADDKARPADGVWAPATSGTTGDPKVLLARHGGLMDNLAIYQHELELTGNDHGLVVTPMYHSLAFLFSLAVLRAGGRVTLRSSLDIDEVASLLREGITVTAMVPTLVARLASAPDLGRTAMALRALISTGSPLHPRIKEQLFTALPDLGLHEGYGSTEMGFVSLLRPTDQRERPTSVGTAVLAKDVRILDAAGSEVPPGEVGELCVKGPLLASELLSGDTLHDHRAPWFPSGDLARVDPSGYIELVDRAKNVIISGGVNIYPNQIEAVVADHPAVCEVAVIATPDDEWGELVTAVVRLHDGATLELDALRGHCREQLASFKLPRRLEVLPDLPHTPSGKIARAELRDQYWPSQERKIH